MKTLYIARHAKSSWKDPDLADIDRPLNKRGKRDAPLMGKVLKKAGVKPDLILTSPAERAVATARIIADKIGYPKDDIIEDGAIYGAGVNDLLKVIHGIDDSFDSAMMFGHNPAFHELAEALTDRTMEKFPTCAVFCVEFDAGSWKDVARKGGTFKFFDCPKKHL